VGIFVASERTHPKKQSGLSKKRREQEWRNEYADFIAAYNKIIAAEGLPLIDHFLNAPTCDELEIDRPKDSIRNIDLGRKSSVRK